MFITRKRLKNLVNNNTHFDKELDMNNIKIKRRKSIVHKDYRITDNDNNMKRIF